MRPSRKLLRFFSTYIAWYMRRHFHAIRISHPERMRRDHDLPLIIFLNHASWWDPLTCILLSRALLPANDHYAPMDEAALKHYGIFRRLGLFPIQMDSARGGAQFLRSSLTILGTRDAILWVTPQGHFSDPRIRPPQLKPGLAALATHLAAAGRGASFSPLAIEYVFWNDRLPEILVQCGEPLFLTAYSSSTPEEWTAKLSLALITALDELAALAIARDGSPFATLLAGRAGTGGLYAFWQRARASLRGHRYVAEHDEIRQSDDTPPRAGDQGRRP